MLEENNEDTLTLPIANVFMVPVRTGIAVTAIGAVIFFAALAPLATALVVIGAAALLLLVGVGIFHTLTCIIKAQYAAGVAKAAAAALTYGFPTYAALVASWPWYVRAVAC
ncbi:hypothetical protein OAD57_06280 [Porticoccaceae bacterium]|nr:hypothetical protein [Porticoccaceae bacterium]